MQRGSLWWANFPEPIGLMPGYRRPVVIIQADEFNDSGIHTVIVVAITSNLRLAGAPGNLFLPAKVSGLVKDSVVNVSQVYTLDKNALTEKTGVLALKVMRQIDEGLRLAMAL